ncbi:hypothetical protein C6N75_26280 [Streptomyces solincola]|uniref:Uncharacterized protein n=1 Tax=Streptomyces solincola TaxID=2100817 RepID=A0A2S9PPI7_9ACTN|nr:hypothetical protein [Streptomyces solincola]PRH76321.1 hypothetical protein C6N75_26280 [Streptomyces solincola]
MTTPPLRRRPVPPPTGCRVRMGDVVYDRNRGMVALVVDIRGTFARLARPGGTLLPALGERLRNATAAERRQLAALERHHSRAARAR